MDGDNINVVVRVRPLNQKEVKVNNYPVVTAFLNFLCNFFMSL
jgi:hypothetical protein